MYLTAFLIEIYGIIGVSMVCVQDLVSKMTTFLNCHSSLPLQQRLGLIRAYLYLAFIAAVLATAAGVLKGVSYFSFAVR
jgi:hypothetical protein